MNDEPSKSERAVPSLDARFDSRPGVRDRLHEVADMMDQAIAKGATADEAEALAIEQLQKLGADIMTDWAREQQQVSLQKAQEKNPSAIRHIKKKIKWFTTYGMIEVEEQLLRLGRRGKELRPFSMQAGVRSHSYSRRLQRVLVDFGAENAFVPAARRVREHYGIEVPVSMVRACTLRHGKAIAVVAQEVKPRSPASTLITEMDGSMVPIVKSGSQADKRKGKTVLWREARLCCARATGEVEPIYGVSLGSAEVASLLWQQTAQLAGCHPRTSVHGVGDGAPWIVDKFKDNFGSQGTYLIDFYHVSEYLSAAATIVARPGKEKQWRRRQQGRLLENRVAGVLGSLEKHLEAPSVTDAPVRLAYRYLHERQNHLDYAGARQRELPIGSGEIESGHRHVIQHRLKIAGGWWTEPNMESMLQLRTARANNWWDNYWAKSRN